MNWINLFESYRNKYEQIMAMGVYAHPDAATMLLQFEIDVNVLYLELKDSNMQNEADLLKSIVPIKFYG